MMTRITILFCMLFFPATLWGKPLPTELFLRGYSVIPSPQRVQLQAGDVEFDSSWVYQTGQIASSHIAVRTLLKDIKEFHSIELTPSSASARKVIRLAITKGSVRTGAGPEIDKQAYQIRINSGLVEITGNGDPGLFYGVQTFLQLLKPSTRGSLLLPACSIDDWPSFQLRFLHWDTKHHQDHLDTLKRYLEWSARFKVNMIGFELEDKFEYPSHPIIGAPGAFTTAELQEIVNYGLERFIQVVPQIQAPAHLAYVLKHPQFADLRADGNNYQACLCDERTYDLIFSMYDDAINATQGVDYFFVSTDEVYYAGICAKCDKPYTPENRSLKWVEFVQRAHDFLAKRGRKMLAWVEYPLLNQHVELLPPDLINGVLGNDPEKIRAEKKRGIRQLAYTSLQGEEYLFPDHLPMKGPQGPTEGRLESVLNTISSGARTGNLLGVYGAAWEDSGLHSETFWLGWATVAQYGWKPDSPSVQQTVAEFMNVYYGPNVSEMSEVYRGLQQQARFFQHSWDRIVSRVRPSGYGNSDGKGIGIIRTDETLPQPALPALPGLHFTPVYVGKYGKLAEEAGHMTLENDVLLHRLYQNLGKADRNRYNLEVLLSLANFTGHHNQLLRGMKSIEGNLQAAQEAAQRNLPKQAIGHLVAAHERAQEIVEERKKTFENLKTVWEKSRYPKGREVNGKKFFHVLDDVKDHWADRRPDLSYMVAPEESIELEKWMDKLTSLIYEYARQNNLPSRPLDEMRLEE